MTFRRVTVLLAMLALGLASCGSDADEGGGGGGSASAEPTALAVEVSESGGGASTLELPTSIEAGLVEVSLENSGKAPHSVQLIRVDGDQTAAQVKLAQRGASSESAPGASAR